jgi:hypothetical protein
MGLMEGIENIGRQAGGNGENRGGSGSDKVCWSLTRKHLMKSRHIFFTVSIIGRGGHESAMGMDIPPRCSFDSFSKLVLS